MANYKGDSDDNIEDDNEKVNHLDNNNKNDIEYIMTAYHFHKSFMYFLMAQDIFLSNKASIAQYFILDQYAKMVF